MCNVPCPAPIDFTDRLTLMGLSLNAFFGISRCVMLAFRSMQSADADGFVGRLGDGKDTAKFRCWMLKAHVDH